VVLVHPRASIKPIIHKFEHLLDDCKGASYRLGFSTFLQTFSQVIITAGKCNVQKKLF